MKIVLGVILVVVTAIFVIGTIIVNIFDEKKKKDEED